MNGNGADIMEKLILIVVIIVLAVASFFLVSMFLGGSRIPEADSFCQTWGSTSCTQAGSLSENWGIELELKESGVVVRKSCLDVMECDNCEGCGFV